MARIETDPNYSTPTFSRATAPTDPFKKEDVQNVAAALSTHDHSTGKGLPLGAGSIANGTITSAMIADLAIDTADLKDGAVTSAKIADGTIATADLANASVTNAKLGSDTARDNLLTNGGFEIWQRGTTGFTASGAYNADRWLNGVGSGSVFNVVQQANPPVMVNSKAALGISYTHSAESFMYQKIEDFTQLRGKTLTFSIALHANAANAVRPFIQYNNNTNTYGSFHPGNSAYQVLTASVAIPTDATAVAAGVSLMASATAIYLDNAMLVVGSVAADYAPLHPADDLARCLRYYEPIAVSGSVSVAIVTGSGTTAAAGPFIPWKLKKAVTPTITITGSWNLQVGNSSGVGATPSPAGISSDGFTLNASGTAVTNGTTYQMFPSASNALGIVAEANP